MDGEPSPVRGRVVGPQPGPLRGSARQILGASFMRFWAVAIAILLSLCTSRLFAQDAGLDFFEKKIRPVLVEHCYSCHSTAAKKHKGGLLLDTREVIRKGGDSGPAVVPGQPADSWLIRAVHYTDPDVRMPPKGKLPAEVIADLERWIANGAADPR